MAIKEGYVCSKKLGEINAIWKEVIKIGKDLLGRKHFHSGFKGSRIEVFFNWRPAVMDLGLTLLIDSLAIEIEIGFWFHLLVIVNLKGARKIENKIGEKKD